MIQRVKMTHEEKVAMYEVVPKEDLIEMLIQCNRVIEMLTEVPKLDMNRLREITEPTGIQKGNDFKEIKGKI